MHSRTALVGPYDRRKDKSRCDNCVKGHLKCDYHRPCTNCVRKHVVCTSAPVSHPKVDISKGKLLVLSKQYQSTTTVIYPPTSDVQTISIACFFDSFLHDNSFTGKAWDRNLVESHLHVSKAYRHVASALGTLYTGIHRRASTKTVLWRALQAYAVGARCLKDELNSQDDENLPAILGSTFLLAVFELMYADNASGWRRHFQGGTRELLRHLGPQYCSSGLGRDLFLQYRLAELQSSIVFAKRSFLAEPAWLQVLSTIWQGPHASERNLKEKILDIGTVCSDICLLTASVTFSASRGTSWTSTEDLQPYAAKGMYMRSLLEEWRSAAEKSHEPATCTQAESIIAWSMYHTLSIYLHSAFAVGATWLIRGITTPILEEDAISQHIASIIDLVAKGLSSTNLSPLTFMLPLQIAGNRARCLHLRARIIDLYMQIEKSYSTAGASIANLSRTWSMSSVLDDPDCAYPIANYHRYSLLGHLRSEVPHPVAEENRT